METPNYETQITQLSGYISEVPLVSWSFYLVL